MELEIGQDSAEQVGRDFLSDVVERPESQRLSGLALCRGRREGDDRHVGFSNPLALEKVEAAHAREVVIEAQEDRVRRRRREAVEGEIDAGHDQRRVARLEQERLQTAGDTLFILHDEDRHFGPELAVAHGFENHAEREIIVRNARLGRAPTGARPLRVIARQGDQDEGDQGWHCLPDHRHLLLVSRAPRRPQREDPLAPSPARFRRVKTLLLVGEGGRLDVSTQAVSRQACRDEDAERGPDRRADQRRP